jgi:Uma2 family endonuclease
MASSTPIASLPPSVAKRIVNETPMWVEEYLAFERTSERRHEYIDGYLIPRDQPSERRQTLVSNMARLLERHLHGTDCHVPALNLSLALPHLQTCAYPDVMVCRGAPDLELTHHDLLTNPVLLIEVVSGHGESYNWCEKFRRYRTIKSLQAYVIVRAYTPHVEHYARRNDGWLLTETSGPDATLPLSSINATLALSVVYRGVLSAHGSADA